MLSIGQQLHTLFLYIDTLEYLNFFIFIISTLFLGLLVLAISLFLSKASDGYSQKFRDKLSPYECGFLPYGDARDRFEIHFYLVALLFIVFDLEIILILPWAINTANPGMFGLYTIILFFFILGIGIIYEWNVGALNWFFSSNNGNSVKSGKEEDR